ncbi:hypothetical protein OESDEN_20381 [Oesophagostomum dentatum]|uniref:Uncharacterized protein n=1 Tax=Oesophagostomum dentatum TaxID=61180 RepID=A0A0B1S4U4_OESDE|nr:hypothetical protein OESDEN_20381 [Oesophagostomum dentatum]
MPHRDSDWDVFVLASVQTEASQAKKGPSSAATVLTMAGLFVVGILRYDERDYRLDSG